MYPSIPSNMNNAGDSAERNAENHRSINRNTRPYHTEPSLYPPLSSHSSFPATTTMPTIPNPHPAAEHTSGSSSSASSSFLSYSSRNSSLISSSSNQTMTSSLSSISSLSHNKNSNTETVVATNPPQSSLYESLREEAALCCPVCGFQVLATNSVASNSNNHHEDLPLGACWICLQAGEATDNHSNNSNTNTYKTFMAKEKQVQEDWQLATSLSVLMLEEEQRQELNQQQQQQQIHGHFDTMQNQHPPGAASQGFWNSTSLYPQLHPDNIGALAAAAAGSHPGQSNPLPQSGETSAGPPDWLVVEEQKAMFEAVAASRRNLVASSPPPTERQVFKPIHNSTGSNSSSKTAGHPMMISPEIEPNYAKEEESGPCVYIGEYNEFGQPHGSHGELIWDKGDRYVGTFHNGMRSEQGTFFFRDGSEYTGDWRDNQMHGYGTRKYANGDTYIGRYQLGQRSGGSKSKCKFRFANGDLYVGGWENDRFHGFGRYFFANGYVLEGTFDHGTKTGKFKRQLPTGELDIVRFEDDRLVGMGVRWNAKRTKTWLLHVVVQEEATKKHHPSFSFSSSSSSASPKSKKLHRRVMGSLGKPLRRRDFLRRTKSVETSLPSSIPQRDAIRSRTPPPSSSFSSSIAMASSSPSFLLPVENRTPAFPQEVLTNIKRSVKIPISQAVSIGYDCEMGTSSPNTVGVAVATLLQS